MAAWRLSAATPSRVFPGFLERTFQLPPGAPRCVAVAAPRPATPHETGGFRTLRQHSGRRNPLSQPGSGLNPGCDKAGPDLGPPPPRLGKTLGRVASELQPRCALADRGVGAVVPLGEDAQSRRVVFRGERPRVPPRRVLRDDALIAGALHRSPEFGVLQFRPSSASSHT